MDASNHLNQAGEVHMVDVSGKPESARKATAEGFLTVSREILARAVGEGAPKGDVLAVARVASIMAAKRTAEWIPLCHPIPITGIEVAIRPESDGIRVRVEVVTMAATGVEMEALTAVSAALLTLYDMLKGMDRGMMIQSVRLLEKTGGQSGHFRARSEGGWDEDRGLDG